MMNPLHWFRKKRQLYVGLDIGSIFIRMIVAQEQEKGKLKVLAACETPSAGVRKGEIVNEMMVKRCVQDLLEDCKQTACLSFTSTYLAVSGDHVKGENCHGSYRLPEEDFIVEEQHISNAREKARGLDLQKDRFVLNEHCGRFYIDKRETTRYPLGLAGRVIELNCHLITASRQALQEQVKLVHQVPLDIDDIVFSSLAAAQTALSYQQREDGALLIDIGGDNTNYICYSLGDIIASGCIAKGGHDINREINQSRPQRMSFKSIEHLKQCYGQVLGDVNDDSVVTYTDENGLRSVSMQQGQLNEIVTRHYHEIFAKIRAELGPQKALRVGMTLNLIGGGSLMRGVDALASREFDLPVYQRGPISIELDEEQQAAARNDLCFCAALGLARYAQYRDEL